MCGIALCIVLAFAGELPASPGRSSRRWLGLETLWRLMMKWQQVATLMTPCLVMLSAVPAMADKDSKKPLQGVWVAQSMQANGKPAPAEAVKRMRFTFKGDKLLIRGNNKSDDRQVECTYKVDSSKTPKHLDITFPDARKAVVAIYEVKGDTLKVCIRHEDGTAKGRPTQFATKARSDLVLVVFKKQKP